MFFAISFMAGFLTPPLCFIQFGFGTLLLYLAYCDNEILTKMK